MTRWTKSTQASTRLTVPPTASSANATDADADANRRDTSEEWAVIRKPGGNFDGHNDGNNVDWFDTMREARAAAERMAAR